MVYSLGSLCQALPALVVLDLALPELGARIAQLVAGSVFNSC